MGKDAADLFLEVKANEDPARYRELAEKYPTISRMKHRRIRRRERTVGLLGLEAAYITPSEANRTGYESIYTSEDGDN